MEKRWPLLSIIVTVYGTENLLPRCIDSVLNCTYKNLQLVIVDDKSPGNVKEIVEAYIEKDSRVKFVQHDVNKGLYLARITGVENAKGDFIAFLDSDDHVSVDLYRRLIEKAITTDSDMVVGEIYLEHGNTFSYNNLFHTRIQDIDVKDEEASKLLFDQEGKDYSLHVVWNKVYRRDLWNKCYPYLKLQTKHLIMCEDVLYSSLFYYFATHITNIHGDFVYYYQSENSSIGLNSNSSKYIKNITDVKLVFDILIYIFKEKIKDTSYLSSIWSWKMLLMRVWKHNIECSHFSISERKKLLKMLELEEKSNEKSHEDSYFYQVITSQNQIENENLKLQICDSEIKVISFDVFDTLVYRPFWNPTDLFYLLGIFVNNLLDAKDFIDFRVIRIEAENKARELKKIYSPMIEEITLDDIYKVIQDYLGIEDEAVEKIKNKEIELEIKYCNPRNYAKELFNMALAIGKKVVITSDMYLPEGVIEKILKKCGYAGYSKIYLSSSIKLTKWTGSLFAYIKNDLKVSTQDILHIGDTIQSDVDMASKQGFKSFYFPKAVDRLTNSVNNLYSGEIFNRIYAGPFALRDGGQYNRFWGWRTLIAIAANKIFDNPYIEFNSGSDFNADPRILGYYLLGNHMFAVSQWLATDVKNKKYKNLNFMARDGYLPMLCFKILNQIYQCDVNVNYLYLTRSVVLPLQIAKSDDFFGLLHNINVTAHSPKNLFEMFNDFLVDNDRKNHLTFCKENGFLYDINFNSIRSYYEFVRLFKSNCIDYTKFNKYIEKVGKYLSSSFNGPSATFDVGYSCRIESILKHTYDYDITPYYIHINNDIPFLRAMRNNIDIQTFYNFSPGVTGVLRELLISKLEPSCKALKIENDKVIPEFRDFESNYIEKYVIELIQKNAVMFVKDVVTLFGQDLQQLYYQREDVSLAIEYFFSSAKVVDRQIFSYGVFEDDLGLGKTVSTLDFWNEQIKNVTVPEEKTFDIQLSFIPSKWKRAVCLYFINRDFLKQKVKEKLSNHKVVLNGIRYSYKGLRSIFRLIKR